MGDGSPQQLPYLLGPLLARGGMAEVYVGKHRSEQFEKLVAIKRILPRYSQDREFLAMLRDEATISGRLQHSNIVQVFGFGRVDSSYAMIMELIPGSDLRALLAQCEKQAARLPLPAALYIAAEVAQGLHYAHQLRDEHGVPVGVVHRDISPQNVLISWQGEVKIIDFGIADAQGKLTETRPGVVKGKYSYMSPEQVSGKVLDARSDVFSLGIVLWEMLAMRRLFNSESEVETMRRIQECKIPIKLADLNSEVSPALLAIVERSLQKEPDRRFRSAGELANALRRHLQMHHPEWIYDDLARFNCRIMDQKRKDIEVAIRQAYALKSLPGTPMTQGGLSFGPRSHSHSRSTPASKQWQGTQQSSQQALSARSTGTPTPSYRMAIAARGKRWLKAGGTQHKSLIAPLLVAVFLVAIGWIMYISFPERPTTTDFKLIIASQPQFVMVSVDGVNLFDGRYVRTPVNLNLAEGSRQITIEREGYERVSLPVTGGVGDQLTSPLIRLDRRSGTQFSVVDLRFGPGVPSDAKVLVDRGQYYGSLPAAINDLIAGREYTLVVDPKVSGRFRCKVRTPPSRNGSSRLEVLIEVQPTQRCVVKTR
jgi:serine/threonine protein kinase